MAFPRAFAHARPLHRPWRIIVRPREHIDSDLRSLLHGCRAGCGRLLICSPHPDLRDGRRKGRRNGSADMHLDPEFLSRIQFAWVVGWHILLPAFTIGLASFIAFLEGAYALTRRPVFLKLSLFWLRIFAVSFGMGVVTGIVMPFQFGTNWSRLSDATGNVISPLLAYEGLTAFFLEATFLGVLLF